MNTDKHQINNSSNHPERLHTLPNAKDLFKASQSYGTSLSSPHFYLFPTHQYSAKWEHSVVFHTLESANRCLRLAGLPSFCFSGPLLPRLSRALLNPFAIGLQSTFRLYHLYVSRGIGCITNVLRLWWWREFSSYSFWNSGLFLIQLSKLIFYSRQLLENTSFCSQSWSTTDSFLLLLYSGKRKKSPFDILIVYSVTHASMVGER